VLLTRLAYSAVHSRQLKRWWKRCRRKKYPDTNEPRPPPCAKNTIPDAERAEVERVQSITPTAN